MLPGHEVARISLVLEELISCGFTPAGMTTLGRRKGDAIEKDMEVRGSSLDLLLPEKGDGE